MGAIRTPRSPGAASSTDPTPSTATTRPAHRHCPNGVATSHRRARFGACAIDLLIEATLAVLVLLAFGSTNKPFTSIAAVWLALTAYETITVATIGATLGKRSAGLRVVALDHEGDVPWSASLR